MEVVLLENIKNLGKIGDIVLVKRGHARNFLIKYGEQLSAKNGFLLYRFMLDSGTGKQKEFIPLNH